VFDILIHNRDAKLNNGTAAVGEEEEGETFDRGIG